MTDTNGQPRRRGNAKDFPLIFIGVQILVVVVIICMGIVVVKGALWVWSL